MSLILIIELLIGHILIVAKVFTNSVGKKQIGDGGEEMLLW